MFQLIQMAILELVLGINFVEYGDVAMINKHENAIVICNHPSLVDWMLIWNFLAKYSHLHKFRVALKAELKNVPFLGYCTQLSAQLFLARNWARDQETISSMIEYYRNYGENYNLLFFPEGTNIHPTTVAKSKQFLLKENLTNFNELLAPRLTGFIHVFFQATGLDGFFKSVEDNEMVFVEDGDEESVEICDEENFEKSKHNSPKSHSPKSNPTKFYTNSDILNYVNLYSSIDAIYDFTLAYTPCHRSEQLNIFLGRTPVVVHTHLQRIDILTVFNQFLGLNLQKNSFYFNSVENNPYNPTPTGPSEKYLALTHMKRAQEQLGAWMMHLWYRKDDKLSRFYEEILFLEKEGIGQNFKNFNNFQEINQNDDDKNNDAKSEDKNLGVNNVPQSGGELNRDDKGYVINGIHSKVEGDENEEERNKKIEDNVGRNKNENNDENKNSLKIEKNDDKKSQQNKLTAFLSDPYKPHNTLLFDRSTYIINSQPVWFIHLPKVIIAIMIIISFFLIYSVLSIFVLTVLKLSFFSHIVDASKQYESRQLSQIKQLVKKHDLDVSLLNTSTPHNVSKNSSKTFNPNNNNHNSPQNPSTSTSPQTPPNVCVDLNSYHPLLFDLLQQPYSIQTSRKLTKLQQKLEIDNFNNNNDNYEEDGGLLRGIARRIKHRNGGNDNSFDTEIVLGNFFNDENKINNHFFQNDEKNSPKNIQINLQNPISHSISPSHSPHYYNPSCNNHPIAFIPPSTTLLAPQTSISSFFSKSFSNNNPNIELFKLYTPRQIRLLLGYQLNEYYKEKKSELVKLGFIKGRKNGLDEFLKNNSNNNNPQKKITSNNSSNPPFGFSPSEQFSNSSQYQLQSAQSQAGALLSPVLLNQPGYSATSASTIVPNAISTPKTSAIQSTPQELSEISSRSLGGGEYGEKGQNGDILGQNNQQNQQNHALITQNTEEIIREEFYNALIYGNDSYTSPRLNFASYFALFYISAMTYFLFFWQ
jgi:1-acyl-sn-glycerol-3-phosphate acyltransferase